MTTENGASNPRRLVNVELQGTAPLLMHRISDAALANLANPSSKVKVGNRTPREEAMACAYIDNDGTLYFPGTAILKMLAEVGSGMKQARTRKSLKWVVGGGVKPPETMRILEPEYDRHGRWDGISWTACRNWDVDTRTGVNQKVKSRVIIHRARIPFWRGTFQLTINTDVVDTAKASNRLRLRDPGNGRENERSTSEDQTPQPTETLMPHKDLIPPGEILYTEFCEPNGIKPYELSRRLHMPFNRVVEILGGGRIHGQDALRLSKFFGNSAEFWLNLQKAYELEKAYSLWGEQIETEITPLGNTK